MTAPKRAASTAAAALALLASGRSAAQAEPPEPERETPAPSTPEPTVTSPPAELEPEPAPAAPVLKEKPLAEITPGGYVEAFFAYNLNRPSNGITNARGFDNRHATFSLTNAVLGTSWRVGPVDGRVALQIGSTPSTYYLGEPALGGTTAANASGTEMWKYLQEAFVAYTAPLGRGLRFQLGLSLSPIGYEALAIKDNWNWSRSNLFFGLPYYHTGLRVTYDWTDELSTTVSVFNGWNSVVDNNEEKSVQSNVTYRLPELLVRGLYFGGVERPTGSPEGPYWRHHLDLIAQVDPTSWLSFATQADYGWEPNRFGTARWAAGALYARVRPHDIVYVALRGDRFHEHLATERAPGTRTSSALFFGGVEWVSSATVTIEVRPYEAISARLEYRHDVAEAPLYYGRNVRGDGTAAAPYVANARTQDTILLGATAWF